MSLINENQFSEGVSNLEFYDQNPKMIARNLESELLSVDSKETTRITTPLSVKFQDEYIFSPTKNTLRKKPHNLNPGFSKL